MNISTAIIANGQYTKRDDKCPRFEFTVNERPAFISEIREDYFSKGYVKLFSFDTSTQWERLLPDVTVEIEDRSVKLLGYTNEPRIRAMAKKFKEDLDAETFEPGHIDIDLLLRKVTQM